MSIFSKLKISKSPKDLAASIDEIDKDIVSCQGEIKRLEDSREHAIFNEGEAAVAQLQKELGEKREHLDLLQIARRGAVSRQAEAEADERRREIEGRASASLALVSEQKRLLMAYHKQATAIAQTAASLKDLRDKLAVEDKYFQTQGRPDLMLGGRLAGELQKVCEASHEEYHRARGHEGQVTALTARPIWPHVDLIVVGYWPPPPMDKPYAFQPLALLK